MSEPEQPVDLTKSGDSAAAPEQTQQLDFDPYRYGLPDHPVPPEFAPPGYRPPAPAAPNGGYPPYGPSSPYGTGPGYQIPPPAGYPPPDYPPAGYAPPNYGPSNYGPPGYGPAGYPSPDNQPWGYPPHGGPMPGYHGYGPAMREHNKGKSIWAMVCGIGSIVMCWLSLLDLVLIVPAVILGAMVLSDKQSSARGMAKAGLICAVIGAAAAIALTVWAVHLRNECGGLSGDSLNQCVRSKV